MICRSEHHPLASRIRPRLHDRPSSSLTGGHWLRPGVGDAARLKGNFSPRGERFPRALESARKICCGRQSRDGPGLAVGAPKNQAGPTLEVSLPTRTPLGAAPGSRSVDRPQDGRSRTESKAASRSDLATVADPPRSGSLRGHRPLLERRDRLHGVHPDPGSGRPGRDTSGLDASPLAFSPAFRPSSRLPEPMDRPAVLLPRTEALWQADFVSAPRGACRFKTRAPGPRPWARGACPRRDGCRDF